MPEMIGTVAPRRSGGLIIALQNGIAFFNPETGKIDSQLEIDTNPRTRFNDGKCDPQGRFWCGTMDIEEKEAIGALYSIDANGDIKQWADNIGVSNGLAWSPDARKMYYIDSPTKNIYHYDANPDTGEIANRSILFQFAEDDGYPDGMTSDAEGNLWIAHWAGAMITQHDPMSGERLHTIPTQAYQTSACCFGGPDFTELYVTSARVGLTDCQQAAFPDSGHLLRIKQPKPGSATHAFAG